jgi:nucleotide-binding universal stress UspA family protein
MGTHGRRGLKRFVIGSVAEEVVRNAPCSVVTLRAIGERSVNVYSDIVVPVDFSPFSRSALRTAVQLASLFDATIQLVHVINHLSLPSFYSPMYGAFEGEHMDKVRADSIELMKEWMEDHDVPFETHVRLGGTSEQIVSYVEELDAPMLVMATHGLTGLQHFLLGSTSEQVIRYSKCPVWVHKMYDKQLVPQEQALTGLLSPAS